MKNKKQLEGGINIVEYTGPNPPSLSLQEPEMEENGEISENLMFDQDNPKILDLFRSTKEANFTKFLDNYEYVEEVLVKKRK